MLQRRFLIRVHRCSSVANNNPEKYWPKTTQNNLATDEHGYLDSLTERVLGAVFEVSNPLGAGFLEKVYGHALMRELALRSIRASGSSRQRAHVRPGRRPVAVTTSADLPHSTPRQAL